MCTSLLDEARRPGALEAMDRFKRELDQFYPLMTDTLPSGALPGSVGGAYAGADGFTASTTTPSLSIQSSARPRKVSEDTAV